MAFIVRNTNNQVSRQSRQNIQLCFSDFTPRQQNTLVSESIVHTCCAFLEVATIWYHPIDKVLGQIKIQHLDEDFSQTQKARLIVVPHHGSWELMNLWLAQQGELFALYKPARNKATDNFVFNHRSRNGARLVPTNTAGIRALLKGLKNKSSCMILPDQRPASNTAQIESMFFSHQAATTLLIKNLATKQDCDLFIGAVTRNLDKGSYDLNIEKIDRLKIIAEDQQSADYLNQIIQNFISKNICQYVWSYRRFSEAEYRAESMGDNK